MKISHKNVNLSDTKWHTSVKKTQTSKKKSQKVTK